MNLPFTLIIFGALLLMCGTGLFGYVLGRFNPADPAIISRIPITVTDHDKVNILYREVWNGTPEDILYAWYRTRLHVDNFYKGSDKEKLINCIADKISEIRKNQKTSTIVTESGKVIPVSSYGGSNQYE